MDRDSRGRGAHLRRQRHSHTLITNNTRQQRGVGSRAQRGGSKEKNSRKWIQESVDVVGQSISMGGRAIDG